MCMNVQQSEVLYYVKAHFNLLIRKITLEMFTYKFYWNNYNKNLCIKLNLTRNISLRTNLH